MPTTLLLLIFLATPRHTQHLFITLYTQYTLPHETSNSVVTTISTTKHCQDTIELFSKSLRLATTLY